MQKAQLADHAPPAWRQDYMQIETFRTHGDVNHTNSTQIATGEPNSFAKSDSPACCFRFVNADVSLIAAELCADCRFLWRDECGGPSLKNRRYPAVRIDPCVQTGLGNV